VPFGIRYRGKARASHYGINLFEPARTSRILFPKTGLGGALPVSVITCVALLGWIGKVIARRSWCD